MMNDQWWAWTSANGWLLPLVASIVMVLAGWLVWGAEVRYQKRCAGDAEGSLRMGWVVADASGMKFRCWDSGPAWTTDPYDALYFARRADAEAFGEDDEDAWRMLFMEYRLTAAEVEARRHKSTLAEAIRQSQETDRQMRLYEGEGPAAGILQPSTPWPRTRCDQ